MNYDKGYCLEKATNVLRDLRLMLADLERNDTPPSELKEAINSGIYSALWDLTKVMSCISETEWDSEDREKVIRNGDDGVEELLVRYGSLAKEQTRRYRIKVAGEKLLALSKEPRAPSRTLMHEILRTIPEQTAPFDDLRDLLEDVTQGIKKWEEVQKWCAVCLANYGDAKPDESAPRQSPHTSTPD